MAEIDYNELFGLEAEDGDDVMGDDGAGEAEADIDDGTAADPEGDNGSEGGSEGDSDGDHGDDDGKGDKGSAAKTQSKEDRRGFAAARRRAEAEAKEREAAAVKAAKEAAVVDTLKAIGAKNPYTGKPIETQAELDEFRASQRDRAKQQYLRSTGQTDEQYAQTVKALPEVISAEKRAADAEKRAEAAEARNREREEADFKLALEAEVRNIAATGEKVATLEDITKLERYPEIRKKINRGYSLEDAYMTVYRDEIEQRQADARAERAARATASKSHMSRTTSKGDAGASVPSDVISEYRMLMPNMSDAEIAKHYNQYKKSKK